MAETREKYIEAVGRRKTAVARVRLVPASRQHVTVNEKDLASYFPIKEDQHMATQPFDTLELPTKFKVTAIIRGGGVKAQAEALRHGVARAVVKYQADLRTTVKKAGFLKRDSRMKERRKFGLRKARRAPQWSKR